MALQTIVQRAPICKIGRMMQSPQRSYGLLAAGVLAALVTLAAGCSSGSKCRFEPERCHSGQVGAFCDDDRDCRGFCCTDDNNCNGGMCTYACDDDRDCPSDMRCEHDMCFYACDDDRDCAIGQSCEHGDTICEWP